VSKIGGITFDEQEMQLVSEKQIYKRIKIQIVASV
jgi:hypothetical protein